MRNKSIIVLLAYSAMISLFVLGCYRSDVNTEQELFVTSGESVYRTYEQALLCAEEILSVFDSNFPTKSLEERKIKTGSCITTELTKSSTDRCDTLAYVFNFDNNEGFTIIAANKSLPPMLAIARRARLA